MLWPYVRRTGPRGAPARIDGWTPPGAWMLEHHGIDLPLEPASALAAIAAVRLADVPVVGGLFTLRGIPFKADMGLRQLFGTPPFLVLDEEVGREVVFGIVGPFWQLRHGSLPRRTPRSPDEFRQAVADGRMAAVGNFRADPRANGSRIWTETWIWAPGVAQALPFTAYWLLVGPFSAWIRRLLLRAARRRALGAAGPDPSSASGGRP